MMQKDRQVGRVVSRAGSLQDFPHDLKTNERFG